MTDFDQLHRSTQRVIEEKETQDEWLKDCAACRMPPKFLLKVLREHDLFLSDALLMQEHHAKKETHHSGAYR